MNILFDKPIKIGKGYIRVGIFDVDFVLSRIPPLEDIHESNKLKKKNPRFFPKRKLQIGTLQSIKNRKDLISPDYIFFDEVHFGYNGSMLQDLIKAFPNAKIIGMSATPIDNKGFLLEGFEKYIKGKPKKELIKLGFLVPFVCFHAVKYDLSDVKIKTTGDYDEKQLEDKVNKKEIMSNLADQWCINCYGEKTIIFCVSIKHCLLKVIIC